MPKKVVVVGGGVIGCSTALYLKTFLPSVAVTLMSEKFSPETTGDGAAGIWEPFVLEQTPMDLQRKWSRCTWDWLMKLLKRPDANTLGLSFCSGYNLSDTKIELPSWHDLLPDSRIMSDKELQRMPEKYKGGFFMTTIMCEPISYLPWLMNRYKDLGGQFIKRKVHSFRELSNDYDVIVNCTGIGAKELCNDNSIVPVRGQVMRVKAPWLRHFYLNNLTKENAVAYIIPNNGCVVLGGTVQKGNYSLDISKEDREHILRETRLIEPTLEHAEIISEWVGQRPSRPMVRLEPEMMELDNGQRIKIVHNYGHGGSGVTIHWGCAKDAVDIVRALLYEDEDSRIPTKMSRL